jgi:hypothetical protein
MNKNNNQKEKLPRSIVIANNKKQNEIKNILSLRDEMIENSIDPILIKKFVDEQYEKINRNYEDKIAKHNIKKEKILQNNEITSKIKNIKKKREKAVDFLLKNKTFLEEHGASKEYIKKYVEKQYNEINEFYDTTNIKPNNLDSDNEFSNDYADFID